MTGIILSIIIPVFILLLNKFYWQKKWENMSEEKRQEFKEGMGKFNAWIDAWMKRALIVLLLFIVALMIFNNLD